MKKLSVILATPMILALTMVCIINTQAQDITPKKYMDNADQNWPSTSGLIIAYHDLSMKPDPSENLDIYEISNFVDESIKKGALLGIGSSSLADHRLNLFKERLEAAANALENSTFEEACERLLDAYLRTDGLSQTPDLVYGRAATILAKDIKLMRTEIIGCE